MVLSGNPQLLKAFAQDSTEKVTGSEDLPGQRETIAAYLAGAYRGPDGLYFEVGHSEDGLTVGSLKRGCHPV